MPQHKDIFDYILLQQDITYEDQKRLNAFARRELKVVKHYEDKKWSLLHKDGDGLAWYSVLDKEGLPQDNTHIIGYINGEKKLLNREEAYEQWFGNEEICTNNGHTYLSVDALSSDDIKILAERFLAYQASPFFPEFSKAAAQLRFELGAVDDSEKQRKGVRNWLHLLCIQWLK